MKIDCFRNFKLLKFILNKEENPICTKNTVLQFSNVYIPNAANRQPGEYSPLTLGNSKKKKKMVPE